MAFYTVRSIVERSCPQRAAETIGIVVGQVVMKTPTAVLTPVTKASKTLADGLKVVPVLGGADFTRLPVVDVGPVLVSIQAALAARELIDRAEHAMDPSALAEGFLAEEASANPKAVSEALRRPPEIIGAASGERLLTGQLAAGSRLVGGEWATRSRSAEASLPVAQGELLGHGMKNPADAHEQVVTKRRLTPLGGIF
ncbi:hypothetical protein PG993_012847 [Apiospora rasikravindrae]|uniref:Uncharacterized protein n=1 Tax=Apiospora rasikravindrae TaxID=990691 RepID=A0ABR1RVY4_9PEZI